MRCFSFAQEFSRLWKLERIAEIAGADVMARTKDGSTPLHWAAEYGQKAGVILWKLERIAEMKLTALPFTPFQ